MSILFSGDFTSNRNQELSLITKNSLIEKYGINKFNSINYHIILGDANFGYPGNENRDRANYEALAARPFPILCVMGNRDPVYGKYDLPKQDIGIGEKVIVVKNEKPFVAYLERGKIYTIDGIKMLVLGGALTITKDNCVPFSTWWEEEYWIDWDIHHLFELLETDNVFDLVISHTGPHTMNYKLFSDEPQNKFNDEVAFLNDKINMKIKFKKWLCSHWHKDEYYFDTLLKKEYQYLYYTTRIMERVDDILITHNGNEAVKK